MQRRRFLSAGAVALAAPTLVPRSRSWFLRNAGTPDDPIRLSSNENPLGLPESAKRAITDAFALGNRYPQLDERLIAAIARKHGVRDGNIVLGAGSTDVLRMLVQSIASRNGRIVVADPTFEHVERYARPFGVRAERVPLTRDAAHDLDRMRDAADHAEGPVLVFLCNPNNPTGTLTPVGDIASWIAEGPDHVTFLVDEAYFDYVDDPSYRTFIPDALRRRNVFVSRTFSKVYGLAGLRVGYGLAHEDTIARVSAYAGDSNVNQLALAGALACIEDHAFIERSLQTNRDGRAILVRTLDDLGIEHLPSQTNFLMHRIRGSHATWNQRMLEGGVLVGRAFPPMLGWSRVSIGTPAEMDLHTTNLRAFRAKGWI